jgi:hypothetical protein
MFGESIAWPALQQLDTQDCCLANMHTFQNTSPQADLQQSKHARMLSVQNAKPHPRVGHSAHINQQTYATDHLMPQISHAQAVKTDQDSDDLTAYHDTRTASQNTPLIGLISNSPPCTVTSRACWHPLQGAGLNLAQDCRLTCLQQHMQVNLTA